MAYDIAPLSFGGILDQGFRLLRDHFARLTTPLVAVYVPYGIVAGLSGLNDFNPRPDFDVTRIIAMFAAVLFLLSVAPYAQLLTNKIAAEVYLDQPTTLQQSMASLRGRFWPFVGTYLLCWMLTTLACCLIIPGIYVAVAWSLFGPVAIVEGVFGMDGLKRSRELVTDNWWRALGINVIVYLIVMIFTMTAGQLLGFIPIVGAAVQGVLQAICLAYMYSTELVLYVDLRCRKESFDLELMSKRVAAEGAAAEATAGPVGPPGPFDPPDGGG